MSKILSVLSIIGLTTCFPIDFASAATIEEFALAVPKQSRISRLEETGPILAPFAHVMFCKRNPEDCLPGNAGASLVELSAASRLELQNVNVAVNRAIRPQPDAPGPVGDRWTLSPPAGDCDDYAVTKRHRLIALGWPVSALRLIVARTSDGEGHAALMVRTSEGDLILDNRFDRIKRWNEAGLAFLKVQSETDPNRWEGVGASQSVASNTY